MSELLTNDHRADTVRVAAPRCFGCGQAAVVELDRVGFELWQLGAPVQAAFPAMPVAEREVLISGTHPACWEELYGA